VGLIGAGHIAASLVEGWRQGSEGPERIILSPRNAETSARLAGLYGGIEVAESNQAVLDRAGTILLARRSPSRC
jgi:pyrroline-5-carboxylate reductase